VSLKGVTGAANIDTSAVEAMIKRIRARTRVPVGVGFGIRDGATAKKVGAIADAVVIGSRIVQDLSEVAPEAAPERARALLREFRDALEDVKAIA
jgi:tryptophan synthase alpha chain